MTARHGLRYPPSMMVGSVPDVERAVDEIGFPCIVKPSRPLGGFKTYLPESAEDLRRWVGLHRSDLPFVVQKFIPGDDRTIHFSALYLDRGEVLARYDGHKLRSYPLGHTTIAESRRDDEIHRHALDFFEGEELSGPVSLEVKRGPDGTLWVIEPTVGRTDFWIGLCTANGVNLPLVEYCHQVGIDLPVATQTNEAVWFNEERDPLGTRLAGTAARAVAEWQGQRLPLFPPRRSAPGGQGRAQGSDAGAAPRVALAAPQVERPNDRIPGPRGVAGGDRRREIAPCRTPGSGLHDPVSRPGAGSPSALRCTRRAGPCLVTRAAASERPGPTKIRPTP